MVVKRRTVVCNSVCMTDSLYYCLVLNTSLMDDHILQDNGVELSGGQTLDGIEILCLSDLSTQRLVKVAGFLTTIYVRTNL